MKKLLLLLALSVITTLAGSAKIQQTYASFSDKQPNCSYTEDGCLYTWTSKYSNNMTMFTIEAGELSNYQSLVFTTSNLTLPDGTSSSSSYRVIFKESEKTTLSTFTYSAAGTYEINISSVTNPENVTLICFAGNCDSGSINIDPTDVYLTKVIEEETDEKFQITGNTYSLNLSDYEVGDAQFNVAKRTAIWTASSSQNISNVRFKVNGDVKDAGMEYITFSLIGRTANCRVFLKCSDGTLYSINESSTKEATSTDDATAIGSVTTLKFNIQEITAAGKTIDYVWVNAAQGNQTGSTFNIGAIVFSKTFNLAFGESSQDACIYPTDFVASGSVILDSDGTLTLAPVASVTDGKLTATFNAVDLSDVKSFVVLVNDDYVQPSSDVYEYLQVTPTTSGNCQFYSSRYGSTGANDNFKKVSAGTTITLNFNTNGKNTTFSTLKFVLLSKTVRTSGVEDVVVSEDFTAPEAEAVYYNLQGAKVSNPEHGIFIRCQGGKTQKVVL